MFNLSINESRKLEKYFTDFSALSKEYESFIIDKNVPRYDFVFDCEDLIDQFQAFENSHVDIKIINIKLSELSKFISDVKTFN